MNRHPAIRSPATERRRYESSGVRNVPGRRRIRGASERAVPRAMEKRDCRNGGEASWGAVRGRGLVGPLTAPQPLPSRHNPTTAGVTAVNTPTYDKSITALLVVDPYNDFISEGGRIWPRIKAVAEANNCVPNMKRVLDAARQAQLRVCFAMHHRYRAGDYESWKYIAPIQAAAWRSKAFEAGSWGGEFRTEFAPAPGEIV